jgi:hypothetical protein
MWISIYDIDMPVMSLVVGHPLNHRILTQKRTQEREKASEESMRCKRPVREVHVVPSIGSQRRRDDGNRQNVEGVPG